MLILKNIQFGHGIIRMEIWIEGKKEECYTLKMSIQEDATSSWGYRLKVLYSEIPEKDKMYERQARMALYSELKYEDYSGTLPEEICSMFF